MSPTNTPVAPSTDPFSVPLPFDPVRALLSWYDANRRELPWRQGRDPYRIWVSEIMLQQTTVTTVLRYYDRFLGHFPDVGALASADIAQVLKLWEGLGYYQRARNLHRSANLVSASGAFPDTVEGWMALPGIGRSTAGAIFSISRDRWAPILDANVRRVVERFFSVERGVPGREPRLWELSDSFGRESLRPGDINQALMELGAVCCVPRSPQCGICPVVSGCRTRGAEPPSREASLSAQSLEGPEMPAPPAVRKKGRALRPRRERVVLLPDRGPLLFVPRGEGRLLEGLFDLYGIAAFPGISSGTLILDGPFAGSRVGKELFSVTHVYSHFFEVVRVVAVETTFEGVAECWVPVDGVFLSLGKALSGSVSSAGALPLTGVAKKILLELRKREWDDGQGQGDGLAKGERR
ncbi:MAG: A/G-specific adenine glycosylase [Leptospirillia bacterium]